MIQLSNDQKSALNALYEWHKKTTPFITLGGYAGTGKTTVISIFRKILFQENQGLKIALCSFTGRASRVLEKTLKLHDTLYKFDNISTIHSLIYAPIENNKKEIIGWKRKENIDFDLIIIDEASMVDENIWHDLQTYHIPIIAVGDHGQLPPIKGNFNLMESPMIKLNQIHRQNEDNPIIKMSKIVRESGYIPAKKYGKYAIKYDLMDFDTKDILNNILENFDEKSLILTGFNNTRIKLNNAIRSQNFFESETPQIQDRVICLKNNHEKRIYNGMMGKIKHISDFDDTWYEAEIEFEDNNLYKGLLYKKQFNQGSSLNFTKNRKKLLNGDLFDFGYATTVHKAQGSEADKVILFEERSKYMDDEMWARWLYTAITRAKKEIYIFGNN